MLKLNLNHIFTLRRIKKPYTYLKSLGFSHDVAHRLVNHKVSGLKMYQIEKICQALYCTPNDLFEWDGTGQTFDPNHPLSTLKRNEEHLKGLDLLEKLPMSKMTELKNLLDDMNME
ncbi:MAG: helix-turn-helix transcriptional regulator [Reichenbachiella sp.]|uniref:helix-turn-helix domain-containing protein n=1 Tax=Reichenbachiella sp. TaxID=2184521 RepID=UPI00326681A5